LKEHHTTGEENIKQQGMKEQHTTREEGTKSNRGREHNPQATGEARTSHSRGRGKERE
jgi:hypothetical protein